MPSAWEPAPWHSWREKSSNGQVPLHKHSCPIEFSAFTVISYGKKEFSEHTRCPTCSIRTCITTSMPLRYRISGLIFGGFGKHNSSKAQYSAA